MDDSQQQTEEKGAPPPSRPVNLAALAGAIVLIGLVAFAAYRRGRQAGPPPETPTAPAAASTGPEAGTVISAQVPVHLTPEASIIAERYRCICGCNDPLNVCTCSNTPGSRDMKMFVQGLVNESKSAQEIDAQMVQKYGEKVLLSVPAPTPVRTPAPQRPPQRNLRRSNSK